MSAFFKEAISYHTFFFCKPPSVTHTLLSDQALTCTFTDCLISIFSIRGQQNSTSRYWSKSVSIQPTVIFLGCVWDLGREQKQEKTWWVCVDHYFLVFYYSLKTDLFPFFLFSAVSPFTAKGLGLKVSCLILRIFQRNNGYGQRHYIEALTDGLFFKGII